jgi:hypothetical protein
MSERHGVPELFLVSLHSMKIVNQETNPSEDYISIGNMLLSLDLVKQSLAIISFERR